MKCAAFTSPADVGLSGVRLFWTVAGHTHVANLCTAVRSYQTRLGVLTRGQQSMTDKVGPTPAIGDAQARIDTFTAAVADAQKLINAADAEYATSGVKPSVAPIDVDPTDWKRAYTVDEDALMGALQACERAASDAGYWQDRALEDTTKRQAAAGDRKNVIKADDKAPLVDWTKQYRVAGLKEATGIDPGDLKLGLGLGFGSLALLGAGLLALVFIGGKH